MIHHINNETPVAQIEETSELKRMQGSIQELAVYKADNGHNIIIRNGKEVLIPASERKGLLWEMHSTHLESAMMKRLSCGRFFWRGIT